MASSQLLSLGAVIGLLKVSSYFNLEDEENVTYLRAAYITSQVIILGIYWYVSTIITAKNDETKIRYTETKSPWEQAAAMDPNNSAASATPNVTETTVMKYDMLKIKEVYKQTVIPVAIIMFLHFKFGYVRPLLLQSILPFRNVYSNPLVQIHLLGKQAVGDLARPFKVKNMFSPPTETPTPKEVKQMKKKEEKKSVAKIAEKSL